MGHITHGWRQSKQQALSLPHTHTHPTSQPNVSSHIFKRRAKLIMNNVPHIHTIKSRKRATQNHNKLVDVTPSQSQKKKWHRLSVCQSVSLSPCLCVCEERIKYACHVHLLVPLSPSATAAATFVVAHLALGLILTPFTDKTKTKNKQKKRHRNQDENNNS